MTRLFSQIRWFFVDRMSGPGAPPLPAHGQRDPLGPAGERLAARLLRSKGYTILGVNLRVPMGEADILARSPEADTIVLVEVKSRRISGPRGQSEQSEFTWQTPALPPPELSVTARKRHKLTAILKHLSRANAWKLMGQRIDVVAVEWPSDAAPTVRHHVGVIWLRRPGRGENSEA